MLAVERRKGFLAREHIHAVLCVDKLAAVHGHIHTEIVLCRKRRERVLLRREMRRDMRTLTRTRVARRLLRRVLIQAELFQPEPTIKRWVLRWIQERRGMRIRIERVQSRHVRRGLVGV